MIQENTLYAALSVYLIVLLEKSKYSNAIARYHFISFLSIHNFTASPTHLSTQYWYWLLDVVTFVEEVRWRWMDARRWAKLSICPLAKYAHSTKKKKKGQEEKKKIISWTIINTFIWIKFSGACSHLGHQLSVMGWMY